NAMVPCASDRRPLLGKARPSNSSTLPSRRRLRARCGSETASRCGRSQANRRISSSSVGNTGPSVGTKAVVIPAGTPKLTVGFPLSTDTKRRQVFNALRFFELLAANGNSDPQLARRAEKFPKKRLDSPRPFDYHPPSLFAHTWRNPTAGKAPRGTGV